VHSSFFEPAGQGTFRATAATAGPWNPAAQHGGPPSALACRELAGHDPDQGMRLGRVSIDILRPVPVGLLTVRTRMVRPGRRVALLEAIVESGGQEVLIARGWRLARAQDGPVVAGDDPPPQLPADSEPARFPGGHMPGYLSQIEWRFEAGNFDVPGPCRAWGRPMIPLLPGEELTPFGRALLLADSGSGVSMAIDPKSYLFINVDLTVILPRDPVGEWIRLDARTTMAGAGTGLATTVLSDTTGVVGTGVQTLLVAPR
jgi:hypothetical protein